MKEQKFTEQVWLFTVFSFALFFPFMMHAQDIVINSTIDSVYVFDDFDIMDKH